MFVYTFQERRLDSFIQKSNRPEVSSPRPTPPDITNEPDSCSDVMPDNHDVTDLETKTDILTSQSSTSGDSCRQDSEPASSQNTSEYDDDITVTSPEESPSTSGPYDVTELKASPSRGVSTRVDSETVIVVEKVEDKVKDEIDEVDENGGNERKNFHKDQKQTTAHEVVSPSREGKARGSVAIFEYVS